MRRGRFITAVVAAVAAVAFAAPMATAATPQQIGRDLADGRLDGTYTQRELSDYYRNAGEQGYGGPVAQSTPPSGTAGEQTGGVEGAQSVAAGQQSQGTLPFTGFDAALLVAGGLFLLALGAVLRWAGRERASERTGS
jgi:hypothetical protein